MLSKRSQELLLLILESLDTDPRCCLTPGNLSTRLTPVGLRSKSGRGGKK
jgi:hypothetical protein